MQIEFEHPVVEFFFLFLCFCLHIFVIIASFFSQSGKSDWLNYSKREGFLFFKISFKEFKERLRNGQRSKLKN